MKFLRLLLALILVDCVLLVYAQTPPPAGPALTTVEIRPTDTPMQMEALKPLLATNAADRLHVGWPAGMTEKEHFAAVVTGKYELFDGLWPFKPPSGDPAKIAKYDYIEAIKAYPGIAYYEQLYAKDPIKPDSNAPDAVPILVAFYKATGDRKYLELTERAVKAYSLFIDDEIAKDPKTPPGIDRYWTWSYSFVYVPLLELQGTPEFDRMMATWGKSLMARAVAWPLPPGNVCANGMYTYPAIWYELAVKYGPAGPRTQELRDYADSIWNCWWSYRDINEDDPNYTLGDLVVNHAVCLVRGVKWWEDAEGRLLWRDFAEQAGNDGSWPAYGDGGNLGRYSASAMIGELTARYLRDGRYKWLAHRGFWNARERLPQLCCGIGYMNQTYLAMAYLFADETVKETPPTAGVTLTQRHWRDLTPDNIRLGGQWFTLQKKLTPARIIFRAGPRETDDYLLVQAAQQGGHGHTDAGALSCYGGGLAYYLNYATVRLDLCMEAHNLFTLRDPAIPGPWPGKWNYQCTTEAVSVPTIGTAADASYARVHIREYPGTVTTAESWEEVKHWKGVWNKPQAIGYKNWPVRLDRSVLFVNNKFTVVRDVTSWLAPAQAQMGPNWTFGELGSAGTNWVNVWMPKFLNGHFASEVKNAENRWVMLAPVETAPRDLLIWFAPQPGATLTVEKLNSMREQVQAIGCYVKGNSYLNLPQRAWYTHTGDWKPGEPQAFTTVLMPHAPQVNAAALAAGIKALAAPPGCTALKITDGDTQRLIILNNSGKSVTVEKLATDAEAAILTLVKGKPTRLSAWQATTAVLNGKTLAKTAKAGDVDKKL
ncbi:MAG: hypothetical protein ACYC7E_23295 [Armatimonadota bacterium]